MKCKLEIVSTAIVFVRTLTAPSMYVWEKRVFPAGKTSPYKPCTLALTCEGTIFNLENPLGRLKFVSELAYTPLLLSQRY